MPRRTIPLAAVGIILAYGAAGCATSSPSAGIPAPFPGAPIRHDPPRPLRAASTQGLAVVDTALAFRGTPYELGGDNPTLGFDCSGFVRFVFGQHAFALPRTVAEQVKVGGRITRDQIAPGDLIFFSTTAPGATHVGIVIDTRTFVHAPGTGAVVRVERFDTAYWRSRVLDYRRVVQSPPT